MQEEGLPFRDHSRFPGGRQERKPTGPQSLHLGIAKRGHLQLPQRQGKESALWVWDDLMGKVSNHTRKLSDEVSPFAVLKVPSARWPPPWGA